MAKKFSLSQEMLSGISKNTEKVNEIEAKDNFKIDYIHIENIIPSEKNFYEISDVNELAEDILLNGLNHNLVVRSLDNKKYELISGERRYTALKKLVDQGKKQFSFIPCKITNLNDLDAEIVLIQANAQSRELTDSDRLKQIERLTELYNIKKGKGEKIGKIRERIAQDTGLSPAQVGRYNTISKGLISELRSLLDEGKLSVSNANEFATLSEENQKLILDLLKKEVAINKKEANELKEKLKKIEKDRENTSNSEHDVEDLVKSKVKDVILKFEEEKNLIENENKKLKKELDIADKETKDITTNYELKLKLKSTRKDIFKITRLLENNKIMDESTIVEVDKLQSEIEILKKQIDLYVNQEKID